MPPPFHKMLKNNPPLWETWQPEIRATLVFVKRGDEVLLIKKLRGIGAGKINGPGGKIDPGETPQECAIRETQEELHITPLEMTKMGELWFVMSDLPDIHCHVFVAEDFEGVPTATDEAIPMWCKISEIPYDLMWEDDRHWLPQILEGELFDGRFLFSKEKILWKELNFGENAGGFWRVANY